MQNTSVLFYPPAKPHKPHKSYKPICYAGITKNLLRRHAKQKLVSHGEAREGEGRRGSTQLENWFRIREARQHAAWELVSFRHKKRETFRPPSQYCLDYSEDKALMNALPVLVTCTTLG